MALSNKHKKRIDRKFVSIEEELEYTKEELSDQKEVLKSILMMIFSGLFILLCLVLLFDQLVSRFFFPYIKIQEGFGPAQILLSIVIAGIMWWLKRMMR